MMYIITSINLFLLKVSKGKWGNSFKGYPVLSLGTTGCKSGRLRKTPLFFFSDGDHIVLVASRAGTNKNPAWFSNICANSEVSVQINNNETKMLARVADQSEYEYYWEKVTEMFPTWAEMQEKTTRKFPLVIMSPR
jgi:deazaflavin-dependent oxidoreductase (nitroreductase family)